MAGSEFHQGWIRQSDFAPVLPRSATPSPLRGAGSVSYGRDQGDEYGNCYDRQLNDSNSGDVSSVRTFVSDT